MKINQYPNSNNLLSVIKNKSSMKESSSKLITFLNPYSYLLARKNIDIFKEFDEIHIDGIFLVKTLRFFNIQKVHRKSFDMTSLANIVFENAQKERKTLYFIGAKQNEIELTVQQLKSKFPTLDIIGYRDGYLKNNELQETINKIVTLKPNIIICGMGTPLQEKFLLKVKESGWKGTGYTCGGFLHQTSKSINYYPQWINKYNIRWIYRIYDEPKLIKRYLLDYTEFIFIFIKDYFFIKKL